jgi:hypothetical protein
MSTFAMNKQHGLPLATVDNGDGTCSLVVLLADDASDAEELSTNPLNKDRGLPLKTVNNGDGTCSLVLDSSEVGNIFWVREGKAISIPTTRENVCTGPMIIEGTLTVLGRSTVL